MNVAAFHLRHQRCPTLHASARFAVVARSWTFYYLVPRSTTVGDQPIWGVLMLEFPGVAHVAVTVTDLDRSRHWYRALFGIEPVLDEDTGPFHHVVWLLGNTLFGIHLHTRLSSAEPFDEFRPGLDHVAFGCATRAELEDWATKLDSLNIAHGGIVDAPYGSGLSFRDPDHIALEFFAPPG